MNAKMVLCALNVYLKSRFIFALFSDECFMLNMLTILLPAAK